MKDSENRTHNHHLCGRASCPVVTWMSLPLIVLQRFLLELCGVLVRHVIEILKKRERKKAKRRKGRFLF